MPEIAGYKRTQYLVAKKFQLKYVGLILLLVFATAVMCSYVIYYTMMITMGDKLASVYPQGRLMSLVNTVNLRILLSMLLTAPLIIVIGIFASHKIAGPFYRLEKFLDSMAKGNFSVPITLRRNDELMTIADGINKVVDSIKMTVQKENANLSSMSSSLESLRKLSGVKPMDHDELDKALDKLTAEVSALRKEVEKYKI